MTAWRDDNTRCTARCSYDYWRATVPRRSPAPLRRRVESIKYRQLHTYASARARSRRSPPQPTTRIFARARSAARIAAAPPGCLLPVRWRLRRRRRGFSRTGRTIRCKTISRCVSYTTDRSSSLRGRNSSTHAFFLQTHVCAHIHELWKRRSLRFFVYLKPRDTAK